MAGVLYFSKSKSKEWLGFSFTENVAITYCSGLVLLKTLKKGMTGVLIYSKC